MMPPQADTAVLKQVASAGSRQILKSRDDPAPVKLKPKDGAANGPAFELDDDAQCSWAKEGETLTPAKLRSRVEPWLTALCQAEHLSLLAGSGLTLAVTAIAHGGNKSIMPQSSPMERADFGKFQEMIDLAAACSAKAAGRDEGNVEDQLRVANELLRGLEIFNDPSLSEGSRRLRICRLRRRIEETVKALTTSVLDAERALASAPARDVAFNYLVSFLMSFAARSGTRDRLHLFTTNYDRVIEAGADSAGLHLLDRFVGALSPVFRSSRLALDLHYNPPGIRGEPRYLEGVARFTKLHGSLDWFASQGSIRRLAVPFGARDIKTILNLDPAVDGKASQLLIYPNAAKDRETAAHPYVELFRDLAAAICRPNTTLMTYGYSFGDEHINGVITDMLTIPSTHLVVISYDDPLGRIISLYEKIGKPAQISLLIGNHLGSLQNLVDHYLPKPAIDHSTFRMTELLKARWGVAQAEAGTQSDLNAASARPEGDGA